MPSVTGSVWSTDGANFSLTFDIGDLPIYGSGRFISSLVPPFLSKKATMVYTNLDDLTATRDVAGVIGKSSLNMATPKGEATITGNLNEPLPTEVPFTGQITWAIGVKENQS